MASEDAAEEPGREPGAQLDPPRLLGSRDPDTGEVYFPPRRYSVDGRLRECMPVVLSSAGTLSSHTSLGKRHYGEVDLPDGPRIITELIGVDHQINAAYVVQVDQAEDGTLSWRFARA